MFDVFFATVCGRATEDAITRTTNGSIMATFSMAINTDSTTYVSVACFGSMAKFAIEKVKKGDRLTVLGNCKAVEKNGKVYVSVNATSIFPGTYSPSSTAGGSSYQNTANLEDYH